MPLTLLLGLGLAVLLWLWREPLRRRWRRRQISRQPFPAPWRVLLRRQVPGLRRLPADLQLQLKRRVQVFLAEVPFIGCDGLVVTEAMRVVVAAQACLLLLNRSQDGFGQLRQVLLYPAPFLVRQTQPAADGLVQDGAQWRSGESWQQGQVILSWPDVLAGAAQADDGRNVVLHEFAHQLDQANGPANGAPWMAGARRRARWAQVMQAEFEALRARLAAGQATLLDPYAASAPAEFFAVASEVFFEQGPQLAAQHPALFAELRGFYRVDPLSW